MPAFIPALTILTLTPVDGIGLLGNGRCGLAVVALNIRRLHLLPMLQSAVSQIAGFMVYKDVMFFVTVMGPKQANPSLLS